MCTGVHIRAYAYVPVHIYTYVSSSTCAKGFMLNTNLHHFRPILCAPRLRPDCFSEYVDSATGSTLRASPSFLCLSVSLSLSFHRDLLQIHQPDNEVSFTSEYCMWTLLLGRHSEPRPVFTHSLTLFIEHLASFVENLLKFFSLVQRITQNNKSLWRFTTNPLKTRR